MIKSVILRNFKSFADQEIAFGQITLLLGQNGAGKSSAIQAVLLLRQSLDGRQIGPSGLQINGDLVNLGTGVDLLRQGADEEEIGIEVVEESRRSVLAFDYQPTADHLKLKSGSLDSLALTAEDFWYLSADRLGPRLTSPRVVARAEKKDIGVRGEGALAVLEASRADVLPTDDPRRMGQSGSLEELFQFHLSGICPGSRIELRPYGNVDSIGSSFSFTSPGGVPGLPFRPTNVGFGLSYALPIIVGCLVASKGSLLIVENPEAHLHTTSQRNMCDLLIATAKAGSQVIIETHSREIFYRLRDAARRGQIDPAQGKINYVHATSKDGERLSRVTCLNKLDGSLSEWPEEFFEAFGRPTDLIAPIS